MKIAVIWSFAILTVVAEICVAEKWTGYTYSTVSTTAGVRGMQRIAERLSSATNGEVDLRIHLGKTLQIASSDITQAVGDGVVDFAADFFFSGNVPIARVLNLPLLIESNSEWEKAYAAVEPILIEAFAAQGVVLLGCYRYPEQTIFTTFEVDQLDDLSGHKIRVTSPEQGKFVEAFGGAAITLSGSDVPTSLERGLIEGVLTASAGGAKNWHEFLPYNYRFTVNYGNSMILVNADSFAALSAEEQIALRKIVAQETHATTEEFLVDEDFQKTKQAGSGMNLIDVVDGDLEKARKKLTPFWESWAVERGAEYEQALKLIRQALGK